VAVDQEESDLAEVVSLFKEGVGIEDVADALGHLLSVHMQVMTVKPVSGHGIGADRF